jgi:hypothetical protein
MIHRVFIILAVLASQTMAQGSVIVAENQDVRLEVLRVNGAWQEMYSAREGSRWHSLLRSGHPLRPEPSMRCNGMLWEPGYPRAGYQILPDGTQSILLEVDGPGRLLSKRITLKRADAAFNVEVTCSLSDSANVSHLLSSYSFVPDNPADPAGCFPDFIFTPQLRPEAEDVIGDHIFRAPAFMLQRGSLFAGLVPDLNAIDVRSRRIQSAGDVRVDSLNPPLVSYGLLPWTRRGHVYYRHTDSMSIPLRDTVVRFGYTLLLSAKAPAQNGYREAVRFLWSEYGRQSLSASSGPQTEPFSAYISTAWYKYLSMVALDTIYDGVPVTLLRQGRLAWSNSLPKSADNDAWFNVWFNSLRTAYGMYLYARGSGDVRLCEQAERVLNLALAAPNTGGIAPSIFYEDSLGGHWVPDHAWGGIRNGNCYAMFHNAWTCYWMLEWSELVPSRKTEILKYTQRFADFLIAKQQSNGVIPSWYDPVTLKPVPEFQDENAETAGAALFLAEFARRSGLPRYRDAAEKAMRYVFNDIVPQRKWFDFETFYSCARKPADFFDAYTHQYPQNTLSMHQAAEACLALFKSTGNPLYRQKGEEILDYLLLYQQVWSPQWLSCKLFGGFGVQNTDGEWSDSRQAYFAITLMRYYQVTGRREYLERAVAAARAQFSLFESAESPRTAENYAHTAVDKLAGVTGLHWGTGSAVVTLHLLTREFGDAYIDMRGDWGVGIDGCTMKAVSVDHSIISVALRDDLHLPRKLRLVCGQMDGDRYELVFNGKPLGFYGTDLLRKGIILDLQ